MMDLQTKAKIVHKLVDAKIAINGQSRNIMWHHLYAAWTMSQNCGGAKAERVHMYISRTKDALNSDYAGVAIKQIDNALKELIK